MSRLPSFSRLYNRNCDTIFFICDLQEKFRPLIYNSETVISTTKFLNDALHVLEIPCVISEQNPKGLGKTVPEITIYDTTEVFEKQEFSMLDGIYRKLDKPNMRKQVQLLVLMPVMTVLYLVHVLPYRMYDLHTISKHIPSSPTR